MAHPAVERCVRFGLHETASARARFRTSASPLCAQARASLPAGEVAVAAERPADKRHVFVREADPDAASLDRRLPVSEDVRPRPCMRSTASHATCAHSSPLRCRHSLRDASQRPLSMPPPFAAAARSGSTELV
eukprot:6080685-Pleurochrysis_carterae.AAC.2